MKLISSQSKRIPQHIHEPIYRDCEYTQVKKSKINYLSAGRIFLSFITLLITGAFIYFSIGSHEWPPVDSTTDSESPLIEIEVLESNADPLGAEKLTVTRYPLTIEVDSDYSEEDLESAADLVIDEIITGDMNQKKQVQKIYEWLRLCCSYQNHSEKHDVFQGAYQMLTLRCGDCYNYYAAAKILFDRLGIENISVEKIPNYAGDSLHFWNLVSLDDGNTWYHFDATPRYGEGANFCLVTDAFIDAYSDLHEGTHNRNKSLYPATPAA